MASYVIVRQREGLPCIMCYLVELIVKVNLLPLQQASAADCAFKDLEDGLSLK
jgi:hypothetical protein